MAACESAAETTLAARLNSTVPTGSSRLNAASRAHASDASPISQSARRKARPGSMRRQAISANPSKA